MTLVITHKYKSEVSISSDSRISFKSSGHIDYGIKIFQIPVKIYGPTKAETKSTPLIYDSHMGLAIVGSSINAYTVKEAISGILQNLQIVPNQTDYSIEGIAKLILKFFTKTSLDLGRIFYQNGNGKISDGLSELILIGFCPYTSKSRVYKFTCDLNLLPIKPYYQEILQDDGIEFFGSGKRLAQLVHASNPNLSPLHVLKQVINDAKDPFVGGGLQHGRIDENTFSLYGVEDYSIHSDGTFKEYIYTLRGINLYKDEFEREDEDFHLSYPFVRPFSSDIKKLIDLG